MVRVLWPQCKTRVSTVLAGAPLKGYCCDFFSIIISAIKLLFSYIKAILFINSELFIIEVADTPLFW